NSYLDKNASWRDLVHQAEAPGDVPISYAIQVARCVEDQGVQWARARAMRASTEAVKHLLGPLSVLVGNQLEHRAPPSSEEFARPVSANGRRPVQIPCCVEDQATLRTVSILAPGEVMDDFLFPFSV